jgi:hypothetical protein
MSLWLVFLVSTLGGGVGAVLGLMIYGALFVSGSISQAEDREQ